MGSFYKHIIRPFLFRQDPERAHEIAVFALKTLGKCRPLALMMEHYNRVKAQKISLFGLEFANRVGIAAGFDKNAECFRAAAALGFGHIEIGTVTKDRQAGNPKPRLFRYPESLALINRMGFNNDGAETIAERLRKTAPLKKNRKLPIGINIGKSKATSLEESHLELVSIFSLLADHADYFTINVSSPNTQSLRKLQTKDYLPTLLQTLSNANLERAKKMGSKALPLLLKIAPDLSYPEIDFILESLLHHNFSGIVATNTTIQRPASFDKIEEVGGLSGSPLFEQSLKIVNYIHKSTGEKLPIIGSGGIMDIKSAGRMLDAGASLLQLYTGLVYNGPFFGNDIAHGLVWSQSSDWI